ncbi:MAG: hypothetical protein QW279_12135 [Candidatus Jordarchaeaceae archaeon]
MSSIKKVKVWLLRNYAAWSSGVLRPMIEEAKIGDEVVYEKEFKKEERIEDVWDDIKYSLIKYFFAIFYPAVVKYTSPPKVKTTNPAIALANQSRYIRYRQMTFPEFYTWNPELGKWHITSEGYARRVIELGEGIEMGISDSVEGYMFSGTEALEAIEEFGSRNAGRKQRFLIFIYPDRYDDEIRATFIIEIEFY